MIRNLVLSGLTAFIVAVCSVSTAGAVTLTINGGQLYGATGVNVGGTLYDVEFLDGSCVNLFGGCKASEFTFQTPDTALSAANALLNQVFLGPYDNTPSLTNGIEFGDYGLILTPFSSQGSPTGTLSFVRSAVAQNNNPNVISDNSAWLVYHQISNDESYVPYRTFAKWTAVPPVPLPAGLPLYAAGLGLMGLIGWRRKQRQNVA